MSRADLNILDLPSIIQNLAQNGRTGILKVQSGDRVRGIRFDSGNVRMVIAPDQPDFLIEALYRTASIDARRRAELRERAAFPPDLCSHLLESGVVGEEEVAEAYDFHLLESVCDLFLWEDVHCEFLDGEPPPEWRGGDLDRPLAVNASMLLMEACRRADEMGRIREVIVSERDVPIRAREVEVEEDTAEAAILLLVDGIRDVSEILDLVQLGRFEALETMASLVQEGTLRFKNLNELVQTARVVKDRSPHLAPDQKIRKITALYERAEELGFSSPQVSLWLARAHERAGDRKEAVRRYVQLGKSLLQGNRVADAAALLGRAADLDPGHVEIRQHLVEAYLAQGEKEKAAAAVASIVADLSHQGNLPEARDYLAGIKERIPANPRVLRPLAELYLETGDRIQAIVEFEELAQVYLDGGQLTEARHTFEKIIEVDEEHIHAHMELANLLQRMGEHTEALQRYKRLAEMLEQSELRDSINWQFLINVYEKIAAIEPENLHAREWLAAAYQRKGDGKSALPHLYALVKMLGGDGADERLERALQAIVELAPHDIDSRERLAKLCEERGRSAEAVRHYLAVSELCFSGGELDRAHAALERAALNNPVEVRIHEGLAEYLERAGRREEAARKRRDVGYLLKVAGRLAESEAAFRKALDLDARFSPALLELAEAYRAAGEKEEAERVLRYLAEWALDQNDGSMARLACEFARGLDDLEAGWTQEVLARASMT